MKHLYAVTWTDTFTGEEVILVGEEADEAIVAARTKAKRCKWHGRMIYRVRKIPVGEFYDIFNCDLVWNSKENK